MMMMFRHDFSSMRYASYVFAENRNIQSTKALICKFVYYFIS